MIGHRFAAKRLAAVAFAAASLVLGGLGVGLWEAFAGNGAAVVTTTTSGTQVVAGPIPQPPFRRLNDLAAFRDSQVAGDKLPPDLARQSAAQVLGGGGLGQPRPESSRLLVGAAGARDSVYAWPIGATGLCVGVHDLASNCVRGFSENAAIGPAVNTIVDGTTYVAGIAVDSVQRVKVQIGSASCTAAVTRNGFRCAITHAVAGPPTITPVG
jgi:hypothetical protein